MGSGTEMHKMRGAIKSSETQPFTGTVQADKFGGQVKIVNPGMIATEFPGRSFDFSNDGPIAEYQKSAGAIMGAMPEMAQNAFGSVVVADLTFGDATDDKNQLRYTAGEDAKMVIAYRQQCGGTT